MKKWIKIVLIGIFLAIFLLSCRIFRKEETPMQKIQSVLNGMNSYYCSADLTRFSQNGEAKFGIKQYYKITGEYRLEMISPDEVSGNYTVYDGNSVCQYNPRVKEKVFRDIPENKARNELFLGNFVKNYMQSEEVSVSVAKIDESRCTVLEAVIPGDNKFTSTEKLWIDNESLKPVKLVIYDNLGNEKYIIEYKEFVYNPDIDDSLFSIDSNK